MGKLISDRIETMKREYPGDPYYSPSPPVAATKPSCCCPVCGACLGTACCCPTPECKYCRGTHAVRIPYGGYYPPPAPLGTAWGKDYNPGGLVID